MKRGYSLAEILIACTLFVLVGLTIFSVLKMVTRSQESAAATYAVTGEADTAIQWFRRDLEDTAIGSVRTYYEPDANRGLRPALSCCSAHDAESGKLSHLMVNEAGSPAWRKHVFYAMDVRPGAVTGDLLRWEQPFTPREMDHLPHVALFPRTPDAGTRKVMMHNLVAPGRAVEGVDSFPPTPWGGFRVQFVRRKDGWESDFCSNANPTQNLHNSQENTRLLEVELALCDPLSRSTNFCSLKFRVNARY